MPGKKKKFIDKKKSVTFHLVHRSQKDPLAADEDAPCFVLEQVGKGDPTIVKQELPPTVFPSAKEEDVGLLNKAAPLRGPQLDWDPDIVATFDDTFDLENSENQLEDDFINKANVSGESDDGSENSNFSDGEYVDDFFDALSFEKDETKSRFTEYSLSSSVLPRSDGLKLLDDRFEQHFKQYEDLEIGALDQDEIAGCLTVESDIFKQLLEEDLKQREKSRKTHFENELTKEWLDKDIQSDSDSIDKLEIEEPIEKWDCETILSTYSNVYNHPQLIELVPKNKVIRISGKTGIPKNTLNEKLTSSQLEQFNKLNKTLPKPLKTEIDSTILIRPKQESKEEKMARKRAVKEHKKQRRIEKKANTVAFKEEKKRQEKILVNIQKNVQAIKLT